jgi:outer membrane protein assembly factor BamB
MPLHDPMSLRRTDSLPGEVPVPDLPRGPGPRWQVKLGGQIWAAAAVHDSVAYVGTTGGVFNAVSLKDGSFVWTFSAGGPMHGEALATDDAVFFVCDNGFLFRLNRATGKEVWRYDLDDAQAPRIMPHQIVYDYDYKSPRPLLADGVIYVGAGDGGFHAVDAASGARVWRSTTGAKIRTDAIVSGTNVVVGSFDNFVYAFDRKSGHEVWKYNSYAEVDGSPALIDGKIVVGNHGSVVQAIDPNTGKYVWRRIWWGSAVESTPVEYAGRIYIGASDLRRITCMEPKDGKVVWRTDVYGWAWARPLVTEKFVYIGTAGGDPYQMRHVAAMTALDRKTGKIAWRWPMAKLPGVLTYGFAAPPALGGNTVVIGGIDGTLYAFPVNGER